MLDEIRPLWEKLNRHHIVRSRDFVEWFEQYTFEKRRDSILEKANGRNILVDLAKAGNDERIVAYCLSTIVEKPGGAVGEIDSIYVEDEFRGMMIGVELMKRALTWFDERNVVSRRLIIAAGNEEVVDFYKQFNFFPRALVLEQKR